MNIVGSFQEKPRLKKHQLKKREDTSLSVKIRSYQTKRQTFIGVNDNLVSPLTVIITVNGDTKLSSHF